MRNIHLFLVGVLAVPVCSFGQMTAYQKAIDFQQLVALYDKDYAFLEWKKSVIGFDALNITPWLAKVTATQSDTEFFQVCMQYVASLQDSHSAFFLNSDFQAQLGFTVDIYSGKYLIDSIARKTLGAAAYPFQIGDEVVSIDGVAMNDLAAQLSAVTGLGNKPAQQRVGAWLATVRGGDALPDAWKLGDSATVAVNQQTGGTVTYQIPWVKTGNPYTAAGKVPDPTTGATPTVAQPSVRQPIANTTVTGESANELLLRLQRMWARNTRFLALDGLKPYFQLPDGFVTHLGTGQLDAVYSGVYQAGGFRIGYLRLPDFEGVEYDAIPEITYLRDATDGLVVDVMGNPGGYGCEAEDIAGALTTKQFTGLRVQYRVTWADLLNVKSALDYEKTSPSATQANIDYLTAVYNTFQSAYNQSRGLSDAIPLCGLTQTVEPQKDKKGFTIGYTKPVLVLTDLFSASAAELFAAMLQDNQIATLYGYRTNGAGGAVDSVNIGSYMEGAASVTRAIVVRNSTQAKDGFPATNFIENIGVTPDVIDDYMTTDHLSKKGAGFVTGFSNAIIGLIQRARPQ